MSEPVVAHAGSAEAALADVLIADAAAPAAGWCAQLLRRYPGAAVVLVVSPTGVVTIGVRHAGVLTSTVEHLCRWAECGEPVPHGRRVPRPERGERVEG